VELRIFVHKPFQFFKFCDGFLGLTTLNGVVFGTTSQ